MGEHRHCAAMEGIEYIKEGIEKVWGEVKPFKYFIHILWEGFLIYELDNLCSSAVSRHVTLAILFNITTFLFSPTQNEAMAPAASFTSLYIRYGDLCGNILGILQSITEM